ncbi:NADH dehydrogenase-like complex subunit L [Natronomonas moolapensis 8.8.11]|uniref:NADH dehydrogenase-like complex subunit L n=1 Tax=Natronomonas moolapensis (strain DSM 18674 / CECT 7526 / JCM 14361 / 8.8.11) TaxID=268739 RepID=M1XT29_NATM8|nr:NADH-quinone oxidoreductase subunit L [Natronomonas moolapensis]CCQ37552.1 NADH dehydrogenase-like complex subunit L [Natronomonas moolapensis 8.8.11]
MALIYELTPAIVLLPLASFALALFFGQWLPKRGAVVGSLATAGTLGLSVATLGWLLTTGEPHNQTWYALVDAEATFDLTFGILIDQLSAAMLVIVSLVAFLVHVFSLGYMNDEGEPGLPRYYAGLGLFTASMLAFVIADNLLMAFVFFELVGLCSYLLIGHWFTDEAPPSAAKKAFLVTRFGDYFFLVGVVGVLVTFGTANFAGSGGFPVLAEEALAAGETFFGFGAETWFSVLGLLVLGGALGKSAQFPFHTWLPDAMEGPTPVSALIHAATMVAAGVYLVARMYGFYALLPTVLGIIAFVGGFTALFAATMAIVKDEIKQVLAYSTISQYGYMMLALGAGSYVAAFFHLTTHAVFKALLFLGAGSVIIAMHHNEDMWAMGGLKDEMRVTYLTFLAGSLALAGIFPFAGFWSKDEVLFETLIHALGGSPLLFGAYAMGLAAVFLTGFYTVRMVLLTFHGDPRSDTAEDPHDVRWNVKLPLAILGVLAVVAGGINLVPVEKLTGAHVAFLEGYLERDLGLLTHGEHYSELLHDYAGYQSAYVGSEVTTLLLGAGLSLGLALLGAGTAYGLYRGASPARHTEKLGGIRTLLMDNYYQDEYQVWLAEGATVRLSAAADTFDQGVIDGAVNAVSSVSLFAGNRLRRIQTGIVTNYAALLLLGLLALLVVFAILGGWL